MPLTLLCIRHGNTFDPGDTILRVGKRTDLALSSSGRAQAEKLGHYFAEQNLRPDLVFTSTLKRTEETARIALAAANFNAPCEARPELDEIDYGIDDGKPESEVIARLGPQTLKDWEEKTIMPAEWSPRPEKLQENAKNMLLGFSMTSQIPFISEEIQTIWLVTSNGIARFFTDGCIWDCPAPEQLKLSTAAFGHLEYDGKDWHIKGWNMRP